MPSLDGIYERLRPKAYGRRQPLVLINGLAEQAESWYRNRRFWGRYFDVHMPNFLVYDGPALHERIAEKKPIDVEYLVERLHTYLFHYAQTPPYHIVASSLGGKIAIEFAAQYPDMVDRLVLLCPSGMGDKETLPVLDGVVRNDWNSVVRSVFYRRRTVDRSLIRYYQKSIANRKWKTGLLRTVRGTLDHTVRDRLKDVHAQTLLISGAKDRICDPKTAMEAAADLPNGHFLSIPKCGHAPQVERHRLINRLVVHYLTAENPTANPGWAEWLLVKPTRVT